MHFFYFGLGQTDENSSAKGADPWFSSIRVSFFASQASGSTKYYHAWKLIREYEVI
jgi:hypothetical protein